VVHEARLHRYVPAQLSEPQFTAFIFPHISMRNRGLKCKLGYHRVFNLILWVLYTDMQWECLPIPRAEDGTAVIHCTTIYKVSAKWADDGSLDQAFHRQREAPGGATPSRPQHPPW
jgi:transposase